MRIAKFIAQAGICSRREAEAHIRAGHVTVNGQVIHTPALNVCETDKVTVKGQLVRLSTRTRLWLYHKPPRLLTTHKDPEGRPTVFENLPADLPRVISIGRLDLFSEGLLLLTNNGDLARLLEHPRTQIKRMYRVCVQGSITADQLKQINQGLTIEGIDYHKVSIEIEKKHDHKTWLLFTLREGKNREIRRISEHFGWYIQRLIRVRYGPFHLGDLKQGQVKELDAEEFKMFLNTENHISC